MMFRRNLRSDTEICTPTNIRESYFGIRFRKRSYLTKIMMKSSCCQRKNNVMLSLLEECSTKLVEKAFWKLGEARGSSFSEALAWCANFNEEDNNTQRVFGDSDFTSPSPRGASNDPTTSNESGTFVPSPFHFSVATHTGTRSSILQVCVSAVMYVTLLFMVNDTFRLWL